MEVEIYLTKSRIRFFFYDNSVSKGILLQRIQAADC